MKRYSVVIYIKVYLVVARRFQTARRWVLDQLRRDKISPVRRIGKEVRTRSKRYICLSIMDKKEIDQVIPDVIIVSGGLTLAQFDKVLGEVRNDDLIPVYKIYNMEGDLI